MKYLIYARVSPKGSTFEGETTVKMQEKICREFIQRQGGEVTAVIADDLISGKDLKRPGIRRILQDLESGTEEWDTLCVYRMDRLTRSLLDQLKIYQYFVDANKGIVSATEPNFNYSTPIGRMQLAQIAAVNQYYREVNAENTRNKMISIAQAGECPYGIPPMGYCRKSPKDNTLVIDPRKAAVVKDIFEMYAGSLFTMQHIIKRTGLSRTAILYILRNKTYLGIINYAGKEYPGRHEPIIGKTLFQEVQNKLPDRKSHSRPKSQKYPYLLSGLVRCSCGRFMTPSSAKSGQYHYYSCTDNIECKKRISAEALEQEIIRRIAEMKFSAEDRCRLLNEVATRRENYLRERTPEIEQLETAIREAKAEQKKIYDAVLSVTGSAIFLSKKLDALDIEISNLETQLQKIKAVRNSSTALFDEMEKLVSHLEYMQQLLVENMNNKEIQRQAIIENIKQITRKNDGTFSISYNYDFFLNKSNSSSNYTEWLPDLDSNQDKLNQNQLCYHYTIGQKSDDAFNLLNFCFLSNQNLKKLSFFRFRLYHCSGKKLTEHKHHCKVSQLIQGGSLCDVSVI